MSIVYRENCVCFWLQKDGKVSEDQANGTSNVGGSALGCLSKKLLQENPRATQRTCMLAPSHRQQRYLEWKGACTFFLLNGMYHREKVTRLIRAGRSVWATVVGARKAAEKPLFPTNKRHTLTGCYPNTPIWFPIDMGISVGGRKCGSSDPARFVRTTTVELRSDRRR